MGYIAQLTRLQVECERDPEFQRVVTEAKGIIRRAYSEYPKKSLVLSFNGGKDATVVFHLVRVVLASIFIEQHHGDDVADATIEKALQDQIALLYFESSDAFPQVTEFVHATALEHGLTLYTYNGGYKQGLEQLIPKHGIRGIFMGVRRTDPHGPSLSAFSPSSEGWPVFMRINPIIGWSYHHIWTFLHDCGFSYCPLYDLGYSSLGDIKSTKKNPALQDPNDPLLYFPAYTLSDPDLERAGR